MKKSLYRDAVKEAKKRGWYERAIDDGILPIEKVEDILKSL